MGRCLVVPLGWGGINHCSDYLVSVFCPELIVENGVVVVAAYPVVEEAAAFAL